MKKLHCLLAVLFLLAALPGCGTAQTEAPSSGDTILATTYPMYYLTSRLTQGLEDITLEQMVTEPVSCLHDYTLTTEQMKKIERADLIVLNGCGLEDFMADALEGVSPEGIIDCGSANFAEDPHYWLNPNSYANAGRTLLEALTARYPSRSKALEQNWAQLNQELEELYLNKMQDTELQTFLSCREMITFHDGFSYFANAMGLTIAASIEEEEGAEASASEIKAICDLIARDNIPAIFVEKNGSTNAAEIIARETGVEIFTLTTIMDGETDYFTAMEENIQAVKEALS